MSFARVPLISTNHAQSKGHIRAIQVIAYMIEPKLRKRMVLGSFLLSQLFVLANLSLTQLALLCIVILPSLSFHTKTFSTLSKSSVLTKSY